MKYRLRQTPATNTELTPGAVVYEYPYYDYGLSAEDTEMTGVPHTSVTLNSDGSPPFFTVPEYILDAMDN